MSKKKHQLVKTKRKLNLKDRLDKIDNSLVEELYNGFYKSRLRIEMGMWRKGKVIEVAAFRGVKAATPSYRQLHKQTGRDREHLKKWHQLYLKYPEKKDFLPIAQEKAKLWTVRAFEQSLLTTDEDKSLVGKMTGNAENYTPRDIIKKVRKVLGGIDLDPASCEYAQRIVRAKKYYTKEDNGLDKPWRGKVFLNPPYGMPDIRNFTDKLITELPNIESAILLTNDQTDTNWWQKCAINTRIICMPNSRINFYTPDKEKTSPTNGQSLFYYGDKEERFYDVFSKMGIIIKVMKKHIGKQK